MASRHQPENGFMFRPHASRAGTWCARSTACLLLLLAACDGGDDAVPDAASADTNIQSAWVVLGDHNQATARVVTSFSQCPLIVVDGAPIRMIMRAAAGTPAQRTTVSAAADSKPSAFPVSVCENALPSTAKKITVGTRALPVPNANPQRVLILADTGCRLQKSSNVYQPCADPTAWPLPTIATSAAAMKPDLILHIGDYHYRENPCPADITGCKDSPWGYGWDVWQADFFAPAAQLLAAAPWVMVRGNHEECARAGQGWFRFLDTASYSAQRSCDDPANDTVANYTDPYAVALGGDSQFIVFDSAKVGTTALQSSDPVFQTYQAQFQKAGALSANTGLNSIFVNHHPILAFAPIKGAAPAPGSAALQSVLVGSNPVSYLPAGIQTVLHGHVHDFQAINFSSKTPATIVSGNGGDNLDVNFSDPFPANTNPAPNAVLSSITHTSAFGFMLMERKAGTSNWNYSAYTAAGKLLTTCAQTGLQLVCDKTGFLAP
jgi:hypothetical protein